jgi:hypothetical protein
MLSNGQLAGAEADLDCKRGRPSTDEGNRTPAFHPVVRHYTECSGNLRDAHV